MTGIPRFEGYEEELREEHGTPGQRVVTVSGLAGVGTSTIAELVADRFDLEHVSAGDFFREKADAYGMDIRTFGERQEVIEERDGVDFDLQWDRKALEYAYTRDDVVLEGRLTGVVLADVVPVRVWVRCDVETVAERLQDRDSAAERLAGMSHDELVAHVRQRREANLQRYREKYGVDPTDARFYSVVVDNSGSLEATERSLWQQLEELGFS